MGFRTSDIEGSSDERFARIEALFEELEAPLLGYALRLLPDRSLAEDAVQEAFMKLHQHFAEVQDPRRWLYRTVRNHALNQLRQSGRHVPLPESGPGGTGQPELTDPDPLPDEKIAQWEGIGLVRLGLEGLDPRARELIHLKFVEELTYQQISERTGLTTGHVGYLLHHAIRAVADGLSKSGGVL